MKQVNRYILLTLSILIVIGMAGIENVEATETLKFEIIKVSTTKIKLKKGDQFDINIEIKESDTKPGESRKVEFDYADFSNNPQIDTGNSTQRVTLPPLTIDGQLNIKGLTYLGGDGNINFTLHAKNVVEAKSATMKLDIEEVHDEQVDLNLEDTSQISVKAGETKKVDVIIRNNSDKVVENPEISVKIEGEKIEGLNIKGGTGINIESISPNSSAKVSFEIETSKALKAGNYKLVFNLAGKTQIVSLRIINELRPPKLEISIEEFEQVKLGTPQPIKIKVKNVGDLKANQIKIELESKEEVVISGDQSIKQISEIAGGQSAYVNYTVKVGPSLAQNKLPLKINYTYQDELGNPNQDEGQYVYIELKSEVTGAKPEVVIDNIIVPTRSIKVDESFNVKFTLSALKEEAKNVRISVSAEDPEAIIPRSQNVFTVPNVTEGAKTQYFVTMSATQKAGNQSHPIKIEVTYDSVVGNKPVTYKQYANVDIYNPKPKQEREEVKIDEMEIEKSQPQIIIDGYKTNPEIVKAGEDFELEIGFSNIDTTSLAYDLRANLIIDKNIFKPVNASNTFYISTLSPGQTVMRNIVLNTDSNVPPKTYQIQIEYEYEDHEGNGIKRVENIQIPIKQTSKIDISEIKIDTLRIGRAVPLNVNLYNTGATNISNLTIYTEGEGFSVRGNKVFIDTLEKGASEYYSPKIVPEKAGLLNGTVIAEYEESTGDVIQIRKDFEFEVTDATDQSPENMDKIPSEEGRNKQPIVLGIGIVMAVGEVLILIKRKKRN